MLKLFRSKFIIALLLIVAVISIGTIGYRYISDFTWLDALYMTVITVTTVGFMEVRPLEDDAKVFTIVLISCSVFMLGYAITVITEYILSRNALQILKKKKVKSRIENLNGHVIVCGFGRYGSQAVERLMAYNMQFVIIEKDEEIIAKHENEMLFLEGDATEDIILQQAGIDRAAYLIVTLPEDADNLFVVLTARQLNSNLFIISRASKTNSLEKIKLAGANEVIMPAKIGGDHMASLVVSPDLITFMDKLSLVGEDSTNLEEIPISEFVDQIPASTLRELDLRKHTGCTIIGYIDPSGNYFINPDPDTEMESTGKVIVLGRPEQIRKLNDMFVDN